MISEENVYKLLLGLDRTWPRPWPVDVAGHTSKPTFFYSEFLFLLNLIFPKVLVKSVNLVREIFSLATKLNFWEPRKTHVLSPKCMLFVFENVCMFVP